MLFRGARLALLLFACAIASSCSSKEFDPLSPHESLLSIAAEFELLDAANPYTDVPARDLTGQHVAKATVVRLANYQSLHPERFAPEVSFLKARAYELLGEYNLARDEFELSALGEPSLKDEAMRRADSNMKLGKLKTVTSHGTVEATIEALRQREGDYLKLSDEFDDDHYSALALIEAEQAATERAELLAANRWILPEGEAAAISDYEQMLIRYKDSHRQLEHALRFASLYRELAEEEARFHPPWELDYDSSRATEYLDKSLDILHRVSQADGREEKAIAEAELETLLRLRELLIKRSN